MSVDLEGFTKLQNLSFGEVYLELCIPFVNTDLHMAVINFSSQKIRRLKIKNKYFEHLPKLVHGHLNVVFH